MTFDALSFIRALTEKGVSAEHAVVAAEAVATMDKPRTGPAEGPTNSHTLVPEVKKIAPRIPDRFQAILDAAAEKHGIPVETFLRGRFVTHEVARIRRGIIVDASVAGFSVDSISRHLRLTKGAIWSILGEWKRAA